jgi:hypothetical protein
MTAIALNRSSAQQPHASLSWLTRMLLYPFLCFGVCIGSASAQCLGAGSPLGRASSATIMPPESALTHLSEVVARLQEQGPEEREFKPMNQPQPVSIVGLWLVDFISGGQLVDVAFDAWHSDSTEVLNDFTNPIQGNVCLGVFEQTGPRAYKLRHPSWSFDTSGNLLGVIVIGEKVTLSTDGNSYTGSYTYDILDNTGKVAEEFTGEVKATRIKP